MAKQPKKAAPALKATKGKAQPKAEAPRKRPTKADPPFGQDRTSGQYIRALLSKGGYTDQQIADMAKKKYGGTTTTKDVSWNRWHMVKDLGMKVGPAKKAA